MSLIVIVPTRGRPANVERLIGAFDETCSLPDTQLVLCFDDDDQARWLARSVPRVLWINVGPRQRLGAWLNQAVAELLLNKPEVAGVGFMGDDHVPRTPGWDAAIAAALAELGTGIAYGNDLFQGENMPTAAFMTADIPKTLGYMCPPTLDHMFIDDVWLRWGRNLGQIRYLPDVVIEHLHPFLGKADWDASYRESESLTKGDMASFDAYAGISPLQRDLEKLKGLLK